ncbi:MAG: cytochrome c biogenesis protein CcsA [Sedimentisphaerales bacterium]|nr:cytochrome c biogenesis protein CcsA [Sedimentisphaerales bacterium]
MRRILMLITCLLLVTSMWIALTKGVIDPVVRNIIYFHVPSSICALVCFIVVLVGSIGYLITKKSSWDHVAAAAAEVGLVFATVLNLTGMIFSRAEWNVWWTPSIRLITSAILWFLYVAYLILRSAIPAARRRGQVCAVFGIIAFLDVPLVYISARLIPDIHKPNFTFDHTWQRIPFVMGIVGTFLLAGLLIWIRADLYKCQNQLEQQLYS